MPATKDSLPAKSRESISAPALSKNVAEIMDEITVSFGPPTTHDSQSPTRGDNNSHGEVDNDSDKESNIKMARTRGAVAREPQDHPVLSTRQRRSKNGPTADDELNESKITDPHPVSKSRATSKRSQSKMSANSTTAGPAAKKTKVGSRSKKWEPENVTQNPRSPLVDADLRALLLQPAAWDCLTAEDKKEILELFPDDTHILDAGTPDARPNLESLRNDDNFRHDAEQYVTNLAKGMHDPAWLKDAWTAHHRRAAGEFDAFYVRRVEMDWNIVIPDEYKPPHLRVKRDNETSQVQCSRDDGSTLEGPTTAADATEEGANAIDSGIPEPSVDDSAETAHTDNVAPSNGSGDPAFIEATINPAGPSLQNGSPQHVRNGQDIVPDSEMLETDVTNQTSSPKVSMHEQKDDPGVASVPDVLENNGADVATARAESASLEGSMSVDRPGDLETAS